MLSTYIIYIYIYIINFSVKINMHETLIINLVPSCYVSTNCNGNPIGNVSTTFFECCTSLSGVSFELEKQCRMCPTSGK